MASETREVEKTHAACEKNLEAARGIAVALLTGGGDRPYVFGLVTALRSKGVLIDLIGSDELDLAEFRNSSGVNFLNLRGDTGSGASLSTKLVRISLYYARLIRYAATAKPKIFHILWNNRFEIFDRTLLMLYYRMLGKKVTLTAHNVNIGKRDHKDTRLNRATLRFQYWLSGHIFVHTKAMKQELMDAFAVQEGKVSVIPLGINNSVPITDLTSKVAKQRLGVREEEKAILFFGRIKPYKGLEYLVAAFRQVLARNKNFRLVIVGRPFDCEDYWRGILDDIRDDVQQRRILLKTEFVPDEETEIYFKAADVLVLPYRDVYQSGVLSLGYSFGLPVIASDVGSLKDDIVEGETGFVCKPEDSEELAKTIERFFSSSLFSNLARRRQSIGDFAARRLSWETVSCTTLDVYARLLNAAGAAESRGREAQSTAVEAKTEP